MPLMSDDDFSIHDDDCEKQESGWMPVSDLPDEVTSMDDLDCACWEEYDSIAEI
ncbi:conserved hypothetical protein [Halorhabdus utahensis DSM 12940]|uniref:Uncharacterized protein n=3 Tax=Halorhabdus TaxID=146825 RepID=C7NUB3_HALUD|nr:conserved hypothetical protein [Halorhabdus utahensis DSM 12940]ERJ04563.1 hypothetical protein HLRTI_003474 [Halorhabdus tiamatea SARL4B]WEL20850.1 Uncharacterized protein HBNXHr_0777 [Halorhabdus sp. BNX81]